MSDHISFLLYDLGNSHLYVTIHTIVLREVLLTLGLQLNRNLINCECTISSSHHHLSPNRESWGITDDFTTSFFHFSLFSTAPRDLVNSKPVHSLMLSSHLFLCPLCLLPPFTVPCKLAIPDERETWPYHCSLRLFTLLRRSSCGPIACWILAPTSSLVTWSLYEMRSTLW